MKHLSMYEVEAKVKLSNSRVRGLIKSGQFPQGEKVGHARIWTESEIDEWLKNREVKKSA